MLLVVARDMSGRRRRTDATRAAMAMGAPTAMDMLSTAQFCPEEAVR